MAHSGELRLEDDDLPLVRLTIDELVAPIIDDLLADGQEWARKEGNATGMSVAGIRRHWLLFVERMTAELARLSRENGALRGQIGEMMQGLAGLDAKADDKHAAVFRPVAQLAPLALIARRASTDRSVTLLSAELVIEYRRKDKTKPGDRPLPWVRDGEGAVGAMANVVAIVVNGTVLHEGSVRPFTGVVDARPLGRLGSETDDAAIARLAKAMLHDYGKVIARLFAAGEHSAAKTLERLPFIVDHSDYGAPLKRGWRPPMSSHFVPGASYALIEALIEAGRPMAVVASPRAGKDQRDQSIGRLRYIIERGTHTMSERELMLRLAELATGGDLATNASDRLMHAINGKLLNPERGPDTWAHVQLRGHMIVLPGWEGEEEPVPVVAVARIGPARELQLVLLRAPTLSGYNASLHALDRRFSLEGRISHESCLRRWRERAAALLVLNGAANPSLRAGIEAACEVSNWVYILAALRRGR